MSSTNPFRLDNEIAIITGGATGIGYGVAQCFVEAGAKVVLIGRRENMLKEAVASLGPSAGYVVGDVTQSEDQLAKLVSEITSRFGAPTILINNAGIHLKKPAEQTTDEEFRKVFDTHVFGSFKMSRAVAPGMLERGKGSIVFMASMASIFALPLVIAYSGAKSAYLGMVRTLATEWGARGVRVNAIAPGWIDTPMMRAAVFTDEARKNRILARTPMNKFGEPRDIGLAAVYLCSPAANFVTGITLTVDGGAAIGF